MSLMIVLEGLDSAGKNTQSKILAANFDKIGMGAVVFSFPRYETTVGRAIKRHLLGEIALIDKPHGEHPVVGSARAPEDALAFQCLMLADKYDAAIDIEAHLDAKRVVICDRWTPSAIAFGEADGLDGKWLVRVQEFLPEADLNIFLDVPEEEALRRRPEMRDRFERDREKQKIVRANYKTLWDAGAEEDPDSWVLVDGVGTIEEVSGRIWTRVLGAFGLEERTG